MEQNLKIVKTAALTLFLLVASYGVFQYVSSYGRGVQAVSTFSAQGEGKAVGIPDIAKFSYEVITQGGKDIVALERNNTKKGNDIVAFIKSQGVADKDIQTEAYSLEPRYENKAFTIVGYTITQSVSVKIRDFSKISDILSGLIGKGANTISRLSFSIDNPTALKQQARTQAIAEARENAVLAAKAGGFKLGRLISMSESGSFPTPLFMGAGNAESAKGPGIEAGSQEVVSNVTLTYEILQ